MIKTLYGKDKKGEFKVWTIEVWNKEVWNNDIGDQQIEAYIKITHGKEGGKLQEKIETIYHGKQGRSELEQAVSEAEGRIKKQIDKGYRENKEELEELPLLPMLAADYNKVGHRIEFPCYGSVKYDGVRCLAIKKDGVVTLQSRTGQPYSLKHLEDALLDFMKDGEVFDGEIYLHGYALQDITSAVKRTDPEEKFAKAQRKLAKASLEDKADAEAEYAEALLIAHIRPKLQFHIFDVPMEGSFVERLRVMDDIHIYRSASSEFVFLTHYDVVRSDEELRNVHHPRAVREGFEGYMLRNNKGVYESGKRSADLQKFKTFVDEEFLIEEIVQDKQGHAVFVLKNNLNEERFQCVMGDMSERKGFVQQKEELKGKWLKVKFQTRYKGTLLPQFPVGLMIRDGYAYNGEFIPYD